MKFLGMNIVLMLNPSKFSTITLSIFKNMRNGLMAVQASWNLVLTLIRENWFLSRRIFAVFVIAQCVSGADLYFGGRWCFSNCQSIQERFPTHRWVFLTLTVKNPPVTELRDTLKHMNDSWQRLIQTKRFKSGVAGFLRTTEVTRGMMGTWWHIRTFMPCCWLNPVISKDRDI